mmetsp:Transcript_12862/g.20418  ORF Transcript_12862/g.20418 Transcript_12862/m.20418 type:complete len:308 (+) Transcript_12862:187-1110(+)|eukprot:CAMPEP_0179427734 /NCGR_PEP_ID=MMETSP0799-20121207/13589_1 /TAXON_ID=46947 /ORGANISM="Geminigera cryophila, Strain CCMP2564" /LENGTH=307 /DNA_ID=CAMNT_0021202891 /DNA_START=132 /DNA_END=1055 /DNA_ORIENTATION=-
MSGQIATNLRNVNMWAKGNDGNHQSEMKDTQGPERVELSLLAGINEWSVDDVVSLFTKCKLVAAADAIAENQVDGKTLCGLADADLYTSVADGGLGLKPLQLKRVRAELAQYQSSDSSGNSSASELSMPRKSFQPELHETDTVYSAQSTGEFNIGAIHYSIDFEAWLNSTLKEMYKDAAVEATGTELRFEIDVVEELLSVKLEEALKFVAIHIHTKLTSHGIDTEKYPIPEDGWFEELSIQLQAYHDNCKEALMDSKAVASRATWNSSVKRRHQEAQLLINRAKAADRAERRGSGSSASELSSESSR